MSSYLERAAATFRQDSMATSSKISVKQRPSAPVSVPSPAPSNTSVTSKSESKDTKRKREPTNVVYSQPAATGYGNEALTQITYVIEFLKKKAEPKTLKEILQYLSRTHADDKEKRLIAVILKRHDRVTHFPDPTLKIQGWDSGTFVHRPIINVRNKADLIAYLQNKPDARGVTVKDLKDGWPDCEDAIDELEAEHKILVTRTKKDNHARMVWGNDPTLVHPVDVEFQVMWHQEQLPDVDELVRKLLEAGQKPASEDPSKRIKAAAKPKEKKKRAARRGGKTTNTHMAHLLKDFSHLKR